MCLSQAVENVFSVYWELAFIREIFYFSAKLEHKNFWSALVLFFNIVTK
jgi:hypothetical protein